MDKYPNTERAGWSNTTAEDATSEELHLVHMIAGPRKEFVTREQYRENMRACAADIREHVDSFLPDKTMLDWLEKYSAYVRPYTEDEGSLPYAKVMIPDLSHGHNGWSCIGEGDTYRDAIKDAMGRLERPIDKEAK